MGEAGRGCFGDFDPPASDRKSLQWSDLRGEGHESYARVAGQVGVFQDFEPSALPGR